MGAPVDQIVAVMRWFGHRVFAIVALGIGVYCLTSVSQVSHLIGQWPTDWGHRIGFGLLLCLLFFFYVVTLLDLWRPLPSTPLARAALSYLLETVPITVRRATRFARWVSEVNGFLVRVATKMQPMSKGVKGYVLPVVMIVGGIGAAMWIPIDIHRPYRLFGSILQSAALWTGFVGAFLFYGKLIGPEKVIQWAKESKPGQHTSRDSAPPAAKRGTSPLDRSTKESRSGWDFTGAVLSWLFVTAIIGEMLWFAAEFQFPGSSHRLYTIWALIHIAVALVVIGAWIDFFQRYSEIPARILAVVVLVIFAWFQGGEVIRDVSDPAETPANASTQIDADKSAADAQSQWMRNLNARLDNMPEGPVVLVAASGGGSRAALFTALVLHLLEVEPMTFPAVESANKPSGTWAEHILMISGVSGGSLATARYLTDPAPTTMIETLRYTGRRELIERTVNSLTAWISDQNAASDKEIKRLSRICSVVRRLGKSEAIDEHKDEDSIPVSDAVTLAFGSVMADDMCADFMAPILRGFLTPFASRGQGLYHFWEQQFSWSGIRLDAPVPQASLEKRPLAFFNVADVDTGRRIILGYPPLPVGLLSTSPSKSTAPQGEQDLTRDDEYAPIAASAAGSSGLTKLTLTRAVRLSANFPFGLQVAEFPRDVSPGQTQDKPANSRTVHILDGGVIDNTGLDSLHAVFESLHRQAEFDPLHPAAKVLQRIRSRGVVIVEIDSGAKPSGSSAENTPFAALAEPLSALTNAAYTNSLRSSDTRIGQVRRNLSHWLPGKLLDNPQRETIPLPVGNTELSVSAEELRSAVPALMADSAFAQNETTVVPLRFVCNHTTRADSHVMTAFALGPQDKSVVLAQFLDQALLWRQENTDRNQIFERSRSAAEKVIQNDEVRQAVVKQLLKAAERESQIALKTLKQHFDDHKDDVTAAELLQTDEDVKAALMRPYVLLMGVRVLSPTEFDSDFAAKGRQLTTLESELSSMFNQELEKSIPIATYSKQAESESDASDRQDTLDGEMAPVRRQFKDSIDAYSNVGTEQISDIARDVVQKNKDVQHKIELRQQKTSQFFEKVPAE